MKKGKPFFHGLKLTGREEVVALPSSLERQQRSGFLRWIRRAATVVRGHPVLLAGGVGLVWALIHLVVVMALVPDGGSLEARYEAISTGEIQAYEEVMNGGLARFSREKMPPSHEEAATMLASELRVAPGYPMVALLVQKALSAGAIATGHASPGARTALLLTAQLMTWMFWAYVIGFMVRWKVSPVAGVLTATLLMLHPEALSLVGIGPGSLFLAMTLGMVFWAAIPGGGMLSAMHGAMVSASRLFLAVPVILSGLFLVRRKRRRGVVEAIRSVERRTWIAIISLLPLLLYLAVLQGRFGAIDLYLKSIGLSSATFSQATGPWKMWGSVSGYVGNRVLFAWAGLAALFLVSEFYLLLQEMWLRVESRFRARVPFYLMGAVLFILAVAGTALMVNGGEGAANGPFAVAAAHAKSLEDAGRFLREPLGFGFELYLMVILAFSHILSRIATRTLPGKAVTVIVVSLMVFLQFWAQEGRGLISLLE